MAFDHELLYRRASSSVHEALSFLQETAMASSSLPHPFRHSPIAVAVVATALAGVALGVVIYSHRSSFIKRRKRSPLTEKQWRDAFDSASGRLIDPHKILKRIRFGGIDPGIRSEVWLFLLSFYDLDSTQDGREKEKHKKWEAYRDLKIQCNLLRSSVQENSDDPKDLSSLAEEQNLSVKKEYLESTLENSEVSGDLSSLDKVQSFPIKKESFESGEDLENSSITCPDNDYNEDSIQTSNLVASSEVVESITFQEEEYLKEKSGVLVLNKEEAFESTSSKNDGEELTKTITSHASSKVVVKCEKSEEGEESKVKTTLHASNRLKVVKEEVSKASEDFITWQRIIRLDAVRMNAEWVPYSPSQANVTQEVALELASSVGLKDDEHLEPCRQHHAARLVSILEAYTLYDPEIGYCQGMSDLLSPFVALLDEDYEAFWCFVQFMNTARHNFRRDEIGIRRQLNKIGDIFRTGDPVLYSHFEKVQAEDCYFVYRMVVVLLRRELTFEQTISLWEVIWAEKKDMALGDVKPSRSSARRKTKKKKQQQQKASDDLILFVIVAAVRRRRKVILAECNGLDEILRECNSMVGHLDVWSLLDDARELLSIVNGQIRD